MGGQGSGYWWPGAKETPTHMRSEGQRLVRVARIELRPNPGAFPTAIQRCRSPQSAPGGGGVDDATEAAAAYFMVNCAHPDHFSDVLDDSAWSRRIRGLRCNASRLSHAELDECEVLDDGDPEELARQYKAITLTMPWLNVFGGCCGSDLRHVARIARAVGG